MKKAVILHATSQNHAGHWYPWLQQQLEDHGYEVWVPDLPGSDTPNMSKYVEYLLNQGWDFDNNLIVGHSSGAVTILGLLQNLSEDVSVNTAVLVGSFSEVLANEPDWEQLKGLFEVPFDFEKIKSRTRQFIFVHGSNDPWCPIEQAQYLHDQLGGEFIVIEGGQHFSTSNDPKWTEFPDLLEIIKSRVTE